MKNFLEKFKSFYHSKNSIFIRVAIFMLLAWWVFNN
ncbi:hypothetical protein MHA_2439 [Mannheimia haemolytica PHL213]|nr:hypothetical protein F382_00805 [Mannheimia haemolytica D153]AGQ38343.1 hypothetical protein J450_04075 [Mannheimia haemolytica D171]AGQ40149.1 hypothetical protein J451_00780 [Mannheimia haemolytica D174]AGR75132.1 hypothetical protein N220_07390 [Mannheimia haemolytica USMARC_2286]EDN75320.1 hypothetical protein MHA_2439 [Mannheimia haemolytica PHL213]EPY99504.1 hypothetical protein L278_09570 [Mannheimia haemolytica D35]EPZ02277.1 hypothetical protein L279_09495 [Mannheimia haemolytica 